MSEVTGLTDFERFTFEHDGRSHDVYRAGNGPAVVVIHEMPGLHPGVVEFARRLIDAGFTTYLPSLFGRPGEPFTNAALRRTGARVCVSREFTMLLDRTSRVATWLRALTAEAFAECGGPGAGVVGMCFTGGFALATAVEPSVLATVISQPALPAPIGHRGRAALGLDEADRRRLQQRTQQGLRLLGLRVTNDKRCPPNDSTRCEEISVLRSKASRSTPGLATASVSRRTPTQC
ncbi:MAG TPA: dienelactone hydrolase family protein [Jatrophihabitans sp.]|nr:dienelactone hydrolase family protein [Jatrophihabitans sp.]